MSNTIYLYLKTHNVTGLKYLGKTERNPFIYNGSGVYWKKHIEKHGNDVTTEILFETTDMEEFRKVGLEYSERWNIVESEEFANLAMEGGEGRVGPHSELTIQKIKESKQNISEETRKKLSESMSGRTAWNKGKAGLSGNKNGFFGKTHSDKQKEKWSKERKSSKHTDETKKKISEANSGVKNSFYGKSHTPEMLAYIASKSSERVECPHCKKVGGKSGMKRWHFDNCKYREI